MPRSDLFAIVIGASMVALAPGRAGAGLLAEPVATAISNPMYVTAPRGDPDRLFIAERSGNIRVLDLTTGQVLPTSFLDVSDTTTTGDGGIQSIAFHPDYVNNGRFFVYTTVANGGVPIDGGSSPFSSVIREYAVSAGDPNVADPTPTPVIDWVQPRSNHNGGWIGFNPKVGPSDPQYLYIMSGDGGKQGDPDNNAQTLENDLLGKVLRIDVENDDFADENLNYAIPDNPFASTSGDDEIWSYGLRNPWRASFDRATGDLWIGDVGQGAREEINFQSASNPGGDNYAWNRREGLIPHLGGPLVAGDVQPVYDYRHGSDELQGNSVVGGYVYRGPVRDLVGMYVFADTVSGRIWQFDPADPFGTVQSIEDELFAGQPPPGLIVSFGEDAIGNLYIVDLSGSVYRIVPEPSSAWMLIAALAAGRRVRRRT
ncbi:MAG: sugar dehydrogenase [Phycisphaeraceae bacterium]|nr:sugar dehydrogenase [Phycisphaeraceae bacterium]